MPAQVLPLCVLPFGQGAWRCHNGPTAAVPSPETEGISPPWLHIPCIAVFLVSLQRRPLAGLFYPMPSVPPLKHTSPYLSHSDALWGLAAW